MAPAALVAGKARASVIRQRNLSRHLLLMRTLSSAAVPYISPRPRYSGGEGWGVRGLEMCEASAPSPQPLSPGLPGARGFGFLVTLAPAFLLLMPATSSAQPRGPVSIDKVLVGYVTDGERTQFKSGAWTPVYVDLTAGPLGLSKAELVVETDDSDDVRSRYTVPIPPLDPKEQTT